MAANVTEEPDGAYMAQTMKMRDPAWTDPTEEQLLSLRQAVHDLAEQTGGEMWIRRDEVAALEAGNAKQQEVAAAASGAADRELATLRALRAVRAMAEELADEVAGEAGFRGAGYPQLGAAWAITKQGARLRWPNAVSALSIEQPADREHLKAYGGEATVAWHANEGGWWWTALAADGTQGDADETYYDSSTAAAGIAGGFLKEHQRAESTS